MLKKIDKLLIKIQDNFCGILFVFIFICCVVQVINRYLLKFPMPWCEEFARAGMIYLTFFAAGLGIRIKAHPSVDFIVKRFNHRAQMVCAVIMELLVLSMSFFIMYYGWQYFLRTMNDFSTVYKYSKSIYFLPIPVGGFIMLCYSIRNIVYYIISFVKNEPMNNNEEDKA